MERQLEFFKHYQQLEQNDPKKIVTLPHSVVEKPISRDAYTKKTRKMIEEGARSGKDADKLVPGQGKHSNGPPVLLPAVKDMLTNEGYNWSYENPGSILVDLRPV